MSPLCAETQRYKEVKRQNHLLQAYLCNQSRMDIRDMRLPCTRL